MQTLEEIKIRLNSFIHKKIDAASISAIHFFQQGSQVFFAMKTRRTPDRSVYGMSSDGCTFSTLDTPPDSILKRNDFQHAVFLPIDSVDGIGYCGDRYINLLRRTTDGQWVCENKSLIPSPRPLQPAGVWRYPSGNLLLYYEKQIVHQMAHYTAHLALFDSNYPDELLWRTTEPIWRSQDQWRAQVVEPLGAVCIEDVIVMYWRVDEQIIYGVHVSGFPYDPAHFLRPHLKIDRHFSNPLIAPNKHNHWESFTTLNPAALYADGNVHILYRAQGYDYISSVGYARSRNGYRIDKRLDHPVYAPHAQFETNTTGSAAEKYISAGGYGGCEDPRVTLLGDTVYMVYVAFDGWSPPRLAMTSLLLDDFLKERWNWAKPVLISPPGVVDKSGCLLPEKIRGKFVFFHRIFPDILIDYVDNLDFDGSEHFLQGQYRIMPRADKWDSRKIGAGAPPIKTDIGWLLIYYGVDDRDASKYHIGAMILDYEHPERVLYRTDHPILSPSAAYENQGFKPGIAYPCGAVLVKNKLLVYYGGADTVVCMAECDVKEFLDDMVAHHTPRLHSIRVQELTL